MANLHGADLRKADLEGADLAGANLDEANLEHANLVGVQQLHKARNLQQVASWQGAAIERKWVERLGLDAEKLGLDVVDDVENDIEDDLEVDHPAEE